MNRPPVPLSLETISTRHPLPLETGKTISSFTVCGLFYCTGGSAVLTLNNESLTLKRGDLYLYTPTSILKIDSISPDLEGTLLRVKLDFILPLANRVSNTESLLYLRNCPCIPLSEKHKATIERILRGIEHRMSNNEFIEESRTVTRIKAELIKALAQTLCFEVLLIFLEGQASRQIPHNRKDVIFHDFMLDLFQNFRLERSVSFYATKQGLTTRYFSAVIKECTGHSALHWITNMVVAEARQLLEETSLSSKEIADRLSFSSPSFFGKYFRLYVGLSPSQYRKRAKTNWSL